MKKLRVRGVLPAPHQSPAVRIALGGREADVHDLLTIYELPLLQQDELLSPWEAVSRVRHQAGELRFYSGDQVDTVLGTPLIRLVEDVPYQESLEDRAHALLTTLNCPAPGDEEREKAPSLLVGFLYLGEGRMRLYVRHQDGPDVMGCDGTARGGGSGCDRGGVLAVAGAGAVRGAGGRSALCGCCGSDALTGSGESLDDIRPRVALGHPEVPHSQGTTVRDR
ncbi:hypothetical protein [Streptomyces sp. NPDC047009]|uniref:hypothetical protein n=1 Tax=unclassified Streptomyces TaxID=2593676 RepID=UPI00340CB1DF